MPKPHLPRSSSAKHERSETSDGPRSQHLSKIGGFRVLGFGVFKALGFEVWDIKNSRTVVGLALRGMEP